MSFDDGYYIGEQDYCSYAIGAYSVVFRSKDWKTVIKAFRKSIEHEKAEFVFNSEVEAAELANATTILKDHVPKFLGSKKIKNVWNLQAPGESWDRDFHLDLAFEMELIPGYPTKMGQVHERGEIKSLFASAGIAYLKDASVFLDSAPYKVIDYGMRDPEDFKRQQKSTA